VWATWTSDLLKIATSYTVIQLLFSASLGRYAHIILFQPKCWLRQLFASLVLFWVAG